MNSADSRPELPFILEGVHVERRRLELVPEIALLLLADDYPDQPLDAADYHRLMAQPPYWAFCWGGGQALARWVLDHPRVVAGRHVIDFGAGSGVAGIAAALAGAGSVLAVDIDPDALQVCQINAEYNPPPAGALHFSTATRFQPDPDALLLAADICYEEAGFAAVIEHIQAGGAALVAESRQRDLHERFPLLQRVAEFQVRTFPDLLESENFDRVQVFATVHK